MALRPGISRICFHIQAGGLGVASLAGHERVRGDLGIIVNQFDKLNIT